MLKKLLFLGSVLFLSASFANTVHEYKGPVANANLSTKAMGFCEVTVQNLSYRDVFVKVYFDNGYFDSFNILRNDPSYHTIGNYYNYDGSCHDSMVLDITTFDGYPVFSGRVFVNNQVTIYPAYLGLKASVEKK